MNVKNIHSEFMNNFEGDSITANHRDNLPVLYKYGAMLFCWDKRLHRVIAVWKSYFRCLQFLYLLNCIMVVQAHWKLSKKVLDAGEISSDIISMVDEMYHQQENKWYP